MGKKAREGAGEKKEGVVVSPECDAMESMI